MIERIVEFSIHRRAVVLLAAVSLLGLGLFAFHRLPIEAYPDVADPWVQVIAQWEGHAPEEVEREVTIPLERVLNVVPNQVLVRSITIPGLTAVDLIFDENTDNSEARQRVLEVLNDAELPEGVTPSLGPLAGPAGEILRFVLISCAEWKGVPECSDVDARATPLSLSDLRDLQEYVVERDLFAVDGVADVSTFGGTIRQYQVVADPRRLAATGVTLDQVAEALDSANANAGGGSITYGEQALNVRALGLLAPSEIADVAINIADGSPVRVRDIGEVQVGYQTRLGRVSIDDHSDVVGATVVMRKGEYTDLVLPRIQEAIRELNSELLPAGVKIHVYQDRSTLTQRTTRTVIWNLTSGILLVSLILLLFLGSARTALIVAVTIPLSLFFAFICLDLSSIPANLLSLGAIDFGMIVDGSIVMAENIFRHLASRRARGIAETREVLREAAHEVSRPIVFAITIIIAAYLPIFTLQHAEGKLFAPMAWTVGFALAGAVLLAITLVPVLASFLLRGEVKERSNPILSVTRRAYLPALRWFVARPWAAALLVVGVLIADLLLFGRIGTEFLPHLNEGALTVHAQLPANVSFERAKEIVDGLHTEGVDQPGLREILRGFPEVTTLAVELGRPDDGTDPSGFYNVELNLFLKESDQWRPEMHGSRNELENAVSAALSVVPGVDFAISQPISDNVEEAMNGVKGELAVKIVGPDLRALDDLARSIAGAIQGIPGVADVSIDRELGQANLHIEIDRIRAERFGLSVDDIERVVEAGVGGSVATRIFEGDRSHDLLVRYALEARDNPAALRRVPIPLDAGGYVPLSEVADVSIRSGASRIYREENERYVAVTFSVRDRDLGSAVAAAQARVGQLVVVPEKYRIEWGGEFEEAQRVDDRLKVVIPLTVVIIFGLLFVLYRQVRSGLIVLGSTLIASPVGGLFALWVTGTHFSVSSGVGFMALFGVSVQTGVILVSYMRDLTASGMFIDEAVTRAADLRLRPVMMTALVASLGLVPAAMSTSIGSDSQRPLAIVIVGGMVSSLAISLFLTPALFRMFAGSDNEQPRGLREALSVGGDTPN